MSTPHVPVGNVTATPIQLKPGKDAHESSAVTSPQHSSLMSPFQCWVFSLVSFVGTHHLINSTSTGHGFNGSKLQMLFRIYR